MVISDMYSAGHYLSLVEQQRRDELEWERSSEFIEKKKPIIKGRTGRMPPEPLPYSDRTMFYPAVYRLFREYHPEGFPVMTKAGAHSWWMIHRYKHQISAWKPLEKTMPDPKKRNKEVVQFWNWLREARGPARKFWRSQSAFIRVMPFDGWWDAVPPDRVVPHPVEICEFRPPRTLALNRNFIALQAWTQGMHVSTIREFMPDEKKPIAEMVFDGLLDFVNDPYVRFIYAHRHINPFVLGFNASPMRVIDRMKWLMYDPLSPTSGELEVILRAPQFLAAEALVVERRRSWKKWERYFRNPFPLHRPRPGSEQKTWNFMATICRTGHNLVGRGNVKCRDIKMDEYARERLGRKA